MTEQYKMWCAKGLLVVFGFLSLFLLSKTISEFHNVAINEPYLNSINVIGEGKVVAVPNIATFSFSVSEMAETVSAAQNLATTKMNKAFAALTSNGVAEKDLKADGYSIYPEYKQNVINCFRYPCPTAEPVIIGYRVSQNVTVKVRDTEKAGTLLTLVGKEEVSNVSNLQFVVDDESTLREEARGKAIADAKAKAEQLAKELGIELGDVIGYYDNDQGGGYPMMDSMSAMYKSEAVMVAPELPAGENTYISQVTVTFEIEE